MSVYRRKSGRWQAVVDIRGPEGQRQHKSLGTFRTQKAAQAAEREAIDARERGVDLLQAEVLFGTIVENFLADADARLAPNTAHRYREIWRVHAQKVLGSIPVGKLRPAHLQGLYSAILAKGRKPRTVHHVHRFLHRVLVWSERLGLVEQNVARRVDPPKPNPSQARALTPEEARTILSASVNSRWNAFFVLALATGARRGEIAALRWSDVDLEVGTVALRSSLGNSRKKGAGYELKTTKTGRERNLPLVSSAIKALEAVRFRQAKEAWREGYVDQGFIFADEAGGIPNPDAPTKEFISIARSSGIQGVTLHSCRHSVATWALKGGLDVHTVAGLLGHGKASTTLNMYAHVVEGEKVRAVGIVAAALGGYDRCD